MVNGERLHNGELQDFYFSLSKIQSDQIQDNELSQLCDLYGGEETSLNDLDGKPERTRPLG
jgi:hypothetical protein